MYKILPVIFLCLFLLSACGQNQVILPDNTAFDVELAITPEQAERGLMFRQDLAPNQGMLFVFDKDDWRLFWMKNTLIDLDMIFISSEGKVNNIANNVPHSYIGASDEEIARAAGFGKYVLELNAGTAQKYKIKEGDRLTLKIK